MFEATFVFLFFKQKPAYEVRIRDWSSDVCSSDRGGACCARVGSTPDHGSVAGASITMQSTGQAGTHSSQPVHSGSITTCISFEAPMMASTGQAWMHLVQPMQSASTTSATS